MKLFAKLALGLAISATSPAISPAATQTLYRVPAFRPATAPPAGKPRVPGPLAAAQGGERRATRTTSLSYPYGVGVDAAGNIYVTNLFGGVNEYSSARKLLSTITAGVNLPAAVGISFEGNIYIANNGANNVTIYNPSHQQIGTITDATLVNPDSLSIDADDTVWVLDAGGTLHAYLADGTTLSSTHTGGGAVGPWGPNVTVWGIANTSGTYDEAFENRAQAVHDGPNLFNVFPGGSPYAAGEAQDSQGQQYVTDEAHNQVQIWSSNGQYEVGVINTTAAPYGIAVDPNLKRMYVALTAVNEVAVYSIVAPYKLIGLIK